MSTTTTRDGVRWGAPPLRVHDTCPCCRGRLRRWVADDQLHERCDSPACGFALVAPVDVMREEMGNGN